MAVNEIEQIVDCLRAQKDFQLAGGAGSGKTYTLVQTIREAIRLSPKDQLACITFTNTAVEEINHRFQHPNVFVSTIHEFLWKIIKRYQQEIKITLIELSNARASKNFLLSGDVTLPDDYFDSVGCDVSYRDYVRLAEGVISHDEVIKVASKMFSKHEKLQKILNEKYRYVFVDECQDSKAELIEILLRPAPPRVIPNIVGFFGDVMQSIYDDGIGDLTNAISSDTRKVTKIVKIENRRNPLAIINLANKLRSDLEQKPPNDSAAPNIDPTTGKVKLGKVQFLYSAVNDVELARSHLGWKFEGPAPAKQLSLTHNLIAKKAGYGELMGVYDKDGIVSYAARVRKELKEQGYDMATFDRTFEDACKIIAVELKPVEERFIAERPDLYELARGKKFVDVSSYVSKDQLIDDKVDEKLGGQRDILVRHLLLILELVRNYNEGDIRDFTKKCALRVRSSSDKLTISQAVRTVEATFNSKIREVIHAADQTGLLPVTDELRAFVEKRSYLYDRVSALPYREVVDLGEYIAGRTGYSTQHKTKGREFDQVLVVLDNGAWSKYNFSRLFTRDGNPSVLERTQKLFYVCCTRAKEELAIYFPAPSKDVLAAAELMFGADYVVCLDK